MESGKRNLIIVLVVILVIALAIYSLFAGKLQ